MYSVDRIQEMLRTRDLKSDKAECLAFKFLISFAPHHSPFSRHHDHLPKIVPEKLTKSFS